MRRYRSMLTVVLSISLYGLYSVHAADKKVLDSKYIETSEILKRNTKISSVLLLHDQEVLQSAYGELGPRFEKQGLTEEESAKAITTAWYIMRSSNAISQDTGLTRAHLNDFFSVVQPIVFDSAPRGAQVQLIPDGGDGPIKTRNTVLLKTGIQIKVHFSLLGFADYEETMIAGPTNSVVCRELRPLDPKVQKTPCPK